MRRPRASRAGILLVGLGVVVSCLARDARAQAPADPPGPDWTMAGQNLANTSRRRLPWVRTTFRD
jgi:hypothetical protein